MTKFVSEENRLKFYLPDEHESRKTGRGSRRAQREDVDCQEDAEGEAVREYGKMLGKMTEECKEKGRKKGSKKGRRIEE